MCKQHADVMNRLLIYSLITKEMWTSIIPWFGKRSKTWDIFVCFFVVEHLVGEETMSF